MDNDDILVGARIDQIQDERNAFVASDPFNKSWDDLKTLSGLSNNFKRRASRLSKQEVTDSYLEDSGSGKVGVNGAKSKEINPGHVFRNAYGLFDVITPPWNVYELANYYDTSFANHAAIDAKVENIVGLG